MAKSKLVKANEKIAEKVVNGYKKIEETVDGGYKKNRRRRSKRLYQNIRFFCR